MAIGTDAHDVGHGGNAAHPIDRRTRCRLCRAGAARRTVLRCGGSRPRAVIRDTGESIGVSRRIPRLGRPDPGPSSFAGVVAGNQTVTVDHGGGLRTSYSYLADVLVKRGQRVEGSTTLGTSGVAHGSEGLHFSVRVGGTYVDPLSIIGCRLSNPSKALRLVPLREVVVTRLFCRSAQGHSWRNFRPTSCGSPHCW